MQYARLQDICTLKQWKSLPTRCFTPHGYPVYGANGIIGYYHSYNHKHPVIAITCRGDSCGTVRITQPYAYITSNAICVENVKASISPQYLYYYLKSAQLSPYISGAAQPQITQHHIGKLPIPILPIEQQQYIITCLSKAELITDLYQQQLTALTNLRHAYYSQEISKAKQHPTYREYKLGEIAYIHCGKQNASAAGQDGKYPFFSCAKTPSRTNHYSYDCECLLITGNIDFKLTYYNGRFDAYQRTYIIESRDSSLLQIPYLLAFMQQYIPTLRQQAVGGVIKYIRRHMLTDIRLPIPDTATQLRMGRFSLQLNNTEHKIKAAITQQKQMFDALLQQFFA